MKEIRELVLPDIRFDRALALAKLDKKYDEIYRNNNLYIEDGWLRENDNARNYIKELEEIEKHIDGYSVEYWKNVRELNKNLLKVLGIRFDIVIDGGVSFLYFEYGDGAETINFKLDEIEKIKLTFRYIQELQNLGNDNL
jgi:hypothetical protein